MQQVLFANNAGTTLAAPITNVQTSLTVISGSGALFPAPAVGQYFSLTISVAGTPTTFEIVYCTARSGDTLTVIRAQEGTAPLAFNAGDNAQNLLTAGDLSVLPQLPSANTWTGTNVFDAASVFNGKYSQTFTTSGTWTAPAGVTTVRARLWGAGGCGASGTNSQFPGGGGGGGGYSEGIVTVVPSTTYAVTVGALTGSPGGTGGTTSFASFNSATGGLGGTAGTSGAAGTGGAGGNGFGGNVLNAPGSAGGGGIPYSTTAIEAGFGGMPFGGSGNQRAVGSPTGGLIANAGTFPGGGSTGFLGSSSAASSVGLVISDW